jgi:hypothetical protein
MKYAVAPAIRKHAIAIAPEAMKIDTRNGGSIAKNRTTTEINAQMLAIIATTRQAERSCAIGSWRPGRSAALRPPQPD